MKGMIYQGYVEFIVQPKDMSIEMKEKITKGKRCT